MDARSYFEAVGVHSEWLMWNRLRRDSSLSSQLWEQLDIQHKQHISPEALNQWLINMRGYEFRLRMIRLLSDVLTLGEHLSFQQVVDECVRQSNVLPEDAEAEVRKYYHFTGLGGVYTLGYRELLNQGILSTQAATMMHNTPLHTWQQFHSLPITSHGT